MIIIAKSRTMLKINKIVKSVCFHVISFSDKLGWIGEILSPSAQRLAKTF